MRGLAPRVFTIPPGAPFLPTLVEALLDGSLIGNARLADALIYLPTRRAARAFTAVLGERQGGQALLGPRILSLGEAEETEGAFGQAYRGRGRDRAGDPAYGAGSS